MIDAVDKINLISGSTGVTAQATTDNKVRLLAEDGRDILIENESTGDNLRVQSVGHDGESRFPSSISSTFSLFLNINGNYVEHI